MILASTTDVLKPPVRGFELSRWARLDSDDPTIETTLVLATSLVVSFLKQDLLTRNWSLKYKEWPTVGTYSSRAISPASACLKSCIELPNANLQAVTSVKVNNVVTTDYTIVAGKPTALQFDTIPTYDSDNYALEVEYTAGYGTSLESVPRPIRDAILMVAAYIAEHRGGCDSGDAISQSGAKMFLIPYAVNGGIAL